MRITHYGHSCFSIETKGKHLLIDPFISGNPLAAEVDITALPADVILISHGHQDHVLDAEAIAKRTGATIVAAYEIATWYGNKGLEAIALNHGGSVTVGEVAQVKFVNAVHSSVLPDGTYGGNPGGFVVSNDEGCVYFAGDTALTMDMKLIDMEFNLDMAILPIGDVFTMGVSDAIIACDFVGCNRAIGMHYDTFPPISIDRIAAKDAFTKAGKELILLDIGASLEL